MLHGPRRLLRVLAPQEGGLVPALAALCFEWSTLANATKQAARVRAVQAAYRKAEAASPREGAPTAGQIRSLGLLDKDENARKFVESRYGDSEA